MPSSALHNFSENLLFKVGSFITDLLMRKLKLWDVNLQAFGSMDNVQ